jgi:hypothetical protein
MDMKNDQESENVPRPVQEILKKLEPPGPPEAKVASVN